jgi:hypothetical protein
MYALSFCYEGVDDCTPYASVIAVSEDRDALVQKMKKCVEEDMGEPDPENGFDEWDDTCNWEIFKEYSYQVTLQHKKRINLYGTYRIQSVEFLK